jgi:hypothetical protein
MICCMSRQVENDRFAIRRKLLLEVTSISPAANKLLGQRVRTFEMSFVKPSSLEIAAVIAKANASLSRCSDGGPLSA